MVVPMQKYPVMRPMKNVHPHGKESSLQSRGTGVGKILIFCLCALCIPLHTFASDTGRAGQAGAFLRMGLGARGLAMAGSVAASADDATAAYYNPAAAAFLQNRQVGLSLNSMALDRKLMSVGYAQSFRAAANPQQTVRPMEAGFSLMWIGASVGRIDGRDWDGQHTQTYSNWENAFCFSFALKPAPRVAIGLTGKLLWNTFPHMSDKGEAMSATGFGFDVGAMVQPIRSVTVSVSVHDLRSRYTWDSQKLFERGSQTVVKFPVLFRTAAAWKGFSDRVLMTAQVEQEKNIEVRPARFFPAAASFGVQAEPVKHFFVRAGVRTDEAPAFGFGWRKAAFGKATILDYAFVPDPVAPAGSHVFGWSFMF